MVASSTACPLSTGAAAAITRLGSIDRGKTLGAFGVARKGTQKDASDRTNIFRGTSLSSPFLLFLLAGIIIAGGAGPITIKEAWAGSPGIPMLFLAFQLPLPSGGFSDLSEP